MSKFILTRDNSASISPSVIEKSHEKSKYEDIYNWLVSNVVIVNYDVNNEVIADSYIHWKMLSNNKYHAEYPDMYWPDYWELIYEYVCPSLGVSYESRKRKAAEKLSKREIDADLAAASGKERLAEKIRSRKQRPLNWKKTIKTVQIGNNALEFTCAFNHFIITRAKDLGLDGIEWKWVSFCSNGDPIISTEEVKTRLKDKRDVRSRNPSDRRRATSNFTLGMFTEGDDYAAKYTDMRRVKKYSGDYVRDIIGNDTAIIKAENSQIEENIIITTSRPETKTELFIRELFTEIKLRSSDNDYVFIMENSGIATKLILRSLVGLHKRANIIARLPMKFNSETSAVVRIITDSFYSCELYYPHAGGSIYICAMDFKKNITSLGEKNIQEYVFGTGGTLHMPADVEFENELTSYYEKIIQKEAQMIDNVVTVADYRLIDPTYVAALHKFNWEEKYNPNILPINKRLVKCVYKSQELL